jgi:prepilin-type processing-associated H-X9-DG protein
MTGPQRASPAAAAGRGFPLFPSLLAVAALAVIGGGGFWLVTDSQAAGREAPRIARCQSNLREIGRAIQMYAQDSDGTLPSTNAGKGDVTGLLETYLGSQRSETVWRCPSHAPFSEGRWTSSYGYNWQYLLEPGPDYPHSDYNGFENGGMKVSAITRPFSTVMFVDQRPIVRENWGNLWTYVVRPGQSLKKRDELTGMGEVDRRHRGKANVLFCDGHVAQLGSEVMDEKKYWIPK